MHYNKTVPDPESHFEIIELRGGPFCGQAMRVPADQQQVELVHNGRRHAYVRHISQPVFNQAGDRPSTSRRAKGFCCLDCGRHTLCLNEYYMVREELWAVVVPEQAGMLCIGCLESRLGRRLDPSDFTDAPINKESVDHYSPRLARRLRIGGAR